MSFHHDNKSTQPSQGQPFLWRGMILQRRPDGSLWQLTRDLEPLRAVELTELVGSTQMALKIKLRAIERRFGKARR
jgi:hypothetical protein